MASGDLPDQIVIGPPVRILHFGDNELITHNCDLLYFRDKISDTQKDWKFFEVRPLFWGLFICYEISTKQ